MNPDLLLGIVAALAGFVLKTTLAFGVCLGLVGSSIRQAGDSWSGWVFFSGRPRTGSGWRTAFWRRGTVALRVLHQRSVQTGGFHSRRLADSRLLGLSPWSRAARDRDRLPAGLDLHAGYSYQEATAAKMGSRLHHQPPVEIAAAFQPLAESLNVGRSRLLVLSGVTSPATFGWIRPTILLPDALPGTGPLRSRRYFASMSFTTFVAGILSGTGLPSYAARFFSFIRRPGTPSEECNSTVSSHAILQSSPTLQAGEPSMRSARSLRALELLTRPKAWGIDFAASSEHLKARVHSILADQRLFAAGSLACALLVG